MIEIHRDGDLIFVGELYGGPSATYRADLPVQIHVPILGLQPGWYTLGGLDAGQVEAHHLGVLALAPGVEVHSSASVNENTNGE